MQFAASESTHKCLNGLGLYRRLGHVIALLDTPKAKKLFPQNSLKYTYIQAKKNSGRTPNPRFGEGVRAREGSGEEERKGKERGGKKGR
jgi:hypothetical protein